MPPDVIMAIWTLETDNGTGDMGKLPVIRTLATLAHDCRRTELFQGELIAALKIVQRGDLPLRELIGAYAGEIGQTQFLPSSYIKYGVDFDGNGHVDLRHSVPDVLASTANLLKVNGWQAGAPFGEGTANFEVDARVEPLRDLSQDHRADGRADRGEGDASARPRGIALRSSPRNAGPQLADYPEPLGFPLTRGNERRGARYSSPSTMRMSRTAPSPSALSAA